MQIFLAVCAGIATTALVTVAVHMVLTLTQVRKTAKAVELLALNADGKMNALNGMFSAVSSLTAGLQSGWLKAAQFAFGLISGYKKAHSACGEDADKD